MEPQPILAVCCICGRCYKDGVLAKGRYVSHGYCPKCAKTITDAQHYLILSFQKQFDKWGSLSDRQYEILESIFKQAAENY